MKLYIVGGKSPTGKALIEILRKHKIRFLAPSDKYFDPDNALAIAKSITDFRPDQLINLADFISGNQRSKLHENFLGFRMGPARYKTSVFAPLNVAIWPLSRKRKAIRGPGKFCLRE